MDVAKIRTTIKRERARPKRNKFPAERLYQLANNRKGERERERERGWEEKENFERRRYRSLKVARSFSSSFECGAFIKTFDCPPSRIFPPYSVPSYWINGNGNITTTFNFHLRRYLSRLPLRTFLDSRMPGKSEQTSYNRLRINFVRYSNFSIFVIETITPETFVISPKNEFRKFINRSIPSRLCKIIKKDL